MCTTATRLYDLPERYLTLIPAGSVKSKKTIRCIKERTSLPVSRFKLTRDPVKAIMERGTLVSERIFRSHSIENRGSQMYHYYKLHLWGSQENFPGLLLDESRRGSVSAEKDEGE